LHEESPRVLNGIIVMLIQFTTNDQIQQEI
jgi:hypothetical protein